MSELWVGFLEKNISLHLFPRHLSGVAARLIVGELKMSYGHFCKPASGDASFPPLLFVSHSVIARLPRVYVRFYFSVSFTPFIRLADEK